MLTSLFLLIVVGNGCVLLSLIYSENGIKTRMNFFILHLAIAGDVGNKFIHNTKVVVLTVRLFFSQNKYFSNSLQCILLWNIYIPCVLVFFLSIFLRNLIAFIEPMTESHHDITSFNSFANILINWNTCVRIQ